MQIPKFQSPSKIMFNTFISACSSGTFVVFFRPHFTREFNRNNIFDISHVSNGVFAGLVGITSGCNIVEPWAAFVIGLISGLLFVVGSWILPKIKIEDPSESLPSSFICGLWGVVSTALFAELDEKLDS